MKIVPIKIDDQKSVVELYKSVTSHLRRSKIHQWDWFYPNRMIIGSDLKEGNLYGVKQDDVVIAAVVVNEKQTARYANVNWIDWSGKPACIHRLAVHPQFQGKGLGKKLLQFAEEHAFMQGHSSIRLDVYSGNPAAVGMYRRAGYKEIGIIHFPFRKLPYFCFEKPLLK